MATFTQMSWAEKDRMIEYIKNQKEYHRSEQYLGEYKRLLREAGIIFKDDYLF